MIEEKKSAEETLRTAREQQGKPDDALNLEELRREMGADKVGATDREGNIVETAEDPEMLEKQESEVARAMRLAREKKAAEGSVIEMSPADFQRRQAQQAQVQQQKVTSARLARLLDGKEDPKNEVVDYFLDRLRAGREEFQVTQANIQEVSNRLKQLQTRALQIQGEQNKRVEDIVAWWDRDMKTNAGDPPPDDAGDDLVKGE